jgi:omega-amidase
MQVTSLSLAQIHIDFAQPQKNLAKALSMIKSAVDQGSAMIIFPELWTSGYDLINAHFYAQENKIILGELAEQAQQHAIIIVGSYLVELQGSLYNSLIVLTPDKNRSFSYNKIHLFRLMQEEQFLSAGDRLIKADLGFSQAGLAICYDLRFPELFRLLALQGAGLFILPAEWPKKRVLHWKTLTRARAIENQCFLAGVNAVGKTGGEIFAGASVMIDPWGGILAQANGKDEALLTPQFDPAQLELVRQIIPVWQDRRPELDRFSDSSLSG